jgi:hypothetical protein
MKKRKWEEVSSRLAALQSLYRESRDSEFVSKELLNQLESELSEARKASEIPSARFTERDTSELGVLLRNRAYITAVCDRNASPNSYYSLKVGAEGFWHDGSPTEGFATVDFAFLNPAWLRAKLKYLVLDMPQESACCVASDYSCLLGSSRDQIAVPGRRILRAEVKDLCTAGRPCIRRYGCRLSLRDVFLRSAAEITWTARTEVSRIEAQQKRKEKEKKNLKDRLDSLTEQIESSEGTLRDLLERVRPGSQEGYLKELRRHLNDLAGLRAQREKLSDEAKERDANLGKLERRRAENSGTAPLCRALDDFEALMDRLMLRLEEPAMRALLFGRPRVGPYVLPDPVEVAIAPVWFNARLGTEAIPDISSEPNPTGDPLFPNKPRPIVSFGLQKLFNIRGSSVILGPYVGVGTVLGSLPGGEKSAGNRTFHDLGLYSQTQYRVSAADVAAKVRDVVGSLYVGYRKANYLRRTSPEDPERRIDETDRAIAELRLRYEVGGEQTIKPFIYITVDRSLSAPKRVSRDRLGIAIEVDLRKAFAPLSAALGDVAPPNLTP